MRPRVLIFDLDDTILRSFDAYAATHQRVARELGWPVPTVRDLVPYLHDWEQTLAGLFPGKNLRVFMERYAEVADEHPYDAFPGAVAALESLKEAGHSLFIVTKRDRSRLASRLSQARVPESLFDAIFTREEQPAPKPDPRCFHPVWAALNVASSAELSPAPVYVGDRNEDRLAATAAGVRFVAVRTGPEASLGFPHDHDDSHVIDSIADFPRWLAGFSLRPVS